ncbi:MAG: hypothetical protein WCT04_08920 [Planctomycetota bacterium]
MNYRAMLLMLTSLSVASSAFSLDTGTPKPRRESEDPSYEASRTPGKTKSTAPAKTAELLPSDPVPVAPQSTRNSSSRNAQAADLVVEPNTGPRVKYILDGKPVYEGDVPVTETSPRGSAIINSTTEVPAAPSGPKPKYILDGKPVYEGELPVETPSKSVETPRSTYRDIERVPVAESPSQPAEAPKKKAPSTLPKPSGVPSGRGRPTSPQSYAPSAPSPSESVDSSGERAPLASDTSPYRATPFNDPNDLTADKAGTAGAVAQNPNLLEEMLAPGPVNSKAKKAYALLGELKVNIETVSRCLDNRGKENARLVHTGEEVSKNISAFAAIWPNNDEFRARSSTLKRLALLFNDELNQQPWRWAQVRWSFEALLKDVVGYREYAREIADAELKPIAVLDKKTGKVVYQDQPDPSLSTAEARKAAALKATNDEIVRRRKFNEAVSDSKKEKIRTELDGK